MMTTTEAKLKALVTSLEDQVAHYYPKYEKGVRLQRIMQQAATAAATSSQRRHSTDQPRSQLSTGEKTGTTRVSSNGEKDMTGLKSSAISPSIGSRSSQSPPIAKQPLMGPDRYRSSSISNGTGRGTGTGTGTGPASSLEMVVSIRDTPARNSTSVPAERDRASPPTSNRLFISPDAVAPRPIRRSPAESSGTSRSNSIIHDNKEKEPDSTSQRGLSSHHETAALKATSPSPNQPARRRLSIATAPAPAPAKGTFSPKPAATSATATGTTISTTSASQSPSTSPPVHPFKDGDVTPLA